MLDLVHASPLTDLITSLAESCTRVNSVKGVPGTTATRVLWAERIFKDVFLLLIDPHYHENLLALLEIFDQYEHHRGKDITREFPQVVAKKIGCFIAGVDSKSFSNGSRMQMKTLLNQFALLGSFGDKEVSVPSKKPLGLAKTKVVKQALLAPLSAEAYATILGIVSRRGRGWRRGAFPLPAAIPLPASSPHLPCTFPLLSPILIHARALSALMAASYGLLTAYAAPRGANG